MTEHNGIAPALVAALSELMVVEADQHADAGQYGYDYANIQGVVKTTRPVLAEHGIVALTPLHSLGTGPACSVVLLHTSGERLDFGPFPFPQGRDAQATGSMVTYHRRYALVAALGMAAGKDDDGASAQPAQTEQQAPPVPGFRSSLMAAVDGLTAPEREFLRAWLVEEGLPDRPSLMNQEQADRVCDWILHGLPSTEEVSA